jgi:Ca-activated chloride channel homolog
MNVRKILFLFLFLSFIIQVNAQNKKYVPPKSRILFVFDGSQSMLSKWETGLKINVARNLLIEMIDSLSYLDNVEMALRVYGHQFPVPPQRCDDTKLEVPFAKENASQIKQKLKFINPKGTTPIAHSLELAARDFPECDMCRNIIILITDGIESCDGDPCAVSRALQKEGIILKPFVVGIGLDPEFKETFKCVGRYYDAANEEKFAEVLGVVISQALNSTTAQVNLLDSYGQPTETNVNLTFYDRFSGKMKHNYMHTINHRGVPDTVILDPLSTYDLVVSTIPPVKVDSIKLIPGKHIIVAADAPQGDLLIKKPNSIAYKNLRVLIKQHGKHEILNIQDANQKQKYIVGKYDLEILSLPRLKINDVEIKQSHTTKIEIPSPGLVTFLLGATGYTSLYTYNGNKLEWIYNLDETKTQQSLHLQPGNYKVVYRAKNAKETILTHSKSFVIKSGSSERIKLN